MKVQLNKDQASNLMGFIDHMLFTYPAENRAEKILDILVNRFRVKLWNKLNVKTQKCYSVTLSPEEALGFEEWFCQISSSIQDLQFIFEKNLAKQISNQSNQTYG